MSYQYFKDRELGDVARMVHDKEGMWGEEWNGKEWVESDSAWDTVSDYMSKRISEEEAKKILGIE